MRPFNLDRVNAVKNPVHLSGTTELTPFVREIQRLLVQPQGLLTNKMVTHAGPSAVVGAEEGKGAGVNPTFTHRNQGILSLYFTRRSYELGLHVLIRIT